MNTYINQPHLTSSLPSRTDLNDPECSCFDGFPVLRAVSNHPALLDVAPFKGLGALLLLHARPSLVALVAALIRLGIDPAAITALIKDYRYPEKDAVLDELRQMGVVIAPATEIPDTLAAFSARQAGRPFVCLDDGGHATVSIYQHPHLLQSCLGFVEQTTRGARVVGSAVGCLTKPHLSLPASEIKHAIECSQVGEAIFEATRKSLAGYLDIAASRVVVLGAAGKIGTAARHAFEARGVKARVFDSSPPRYWNLGNSNCASRAEAVQGCDIVIGATGSTVLDISDLAALKDGAVLVSASSEKVEFPVAAIMQLSARTHPFVGADGNVYGTVHHLHPHGKRLILLEDGRPINLGLAAPPEVRHCFDVVLALILAGAIELAQGRYLGRGGWFHDFDDICARYGLVDILGFFSKEATR